MSVSPYTLKTAIATKRYSPHDSSPSKVDVCSIRVVERNFPCSQRCHPVGCRVCHCRQPGRSDHPILTCHTHYETILY